MGRLKIYIKTKKKQKKNKNMNKNFSMLFLANAFVAPSAAWFLSTTFNFGPFANFLLAVCVFGLLFFNALAAFAPKELNLTTESRVPTFLFVLLIVGGLLTPITSMTKLYNQSVSLTNQYKQKLNERVGFYNTMYVTYAEKNKITNVNKEAFIEIAKILMENRKDGANLSWKWVQENQPVPFSEFSAFYKDLSAYVETQRTGFFALEKECQSLMTKHNTMLQTFPNNVYNIVLNRPMLEYKYGVLSQKTIDTFKTGIE
jgi:hypothetical protein